MMVLQLFASSFLDDETRNIKSYSNKFHFSSRNQQMSSWSWQSINYEVAAILCTDSNGPTSLVARWHQRPKVASTASLKFYNKKFQQEPTFGQFQPSVVIQIHFFVFSSNGLNAKDLIRKLTFFTSLQDTKNYDLKPYLDIPCSEKAYNLWCRRLTNDSASITTVIS